MPNDQNVKNIQWFLIMIDRSVKNMDLTQTCIEIPNNLHSREFNRINL